MKFEYVVYLHLNPSTLEVFYVGVGTAKRPYQTLSRNKFWKSYVKKYGNPIVEIYMDGLRKEDAFDREIELIHLFGRRGFEENGQLVNISTGGAGIRGHVAWNKGKTMSDEMRRKRSEYMARQVEYIGKDGRRRLSEKMTGDSNPMRNADTAKKVARTQSKKVYQYDLLGNLVSAYFGVREAAKAMSCDARGLQRAIKGEYKQYKGFIWTHTNKHTHDENRFGTPIITSKHT